MADKTIILITGSNSGIGYDTSIYLANASPNNHIIMSARSSEKGNKAVQEVQAKNLPGSVSFLQLDTTSDDSISAATKQIEEDFGRLDILINNAGIVTPGPVTRASIAQTFDTNVAGIYLLTESLTPLLQKSSAPRIINVSSSLGSIGQRADTSYYENYVPNPIYRMSKAALNMCSMNQRHMYKDWTNPPRVWSYCPGYVITNLTGEEGREMRRKTGAESSETSAVGIGAIVAGERDGEEDKFVTREGKTWLW